MGGLQETISERGKSSVKRERRTGHKLLLITRKSDVRAHSTVSVVSRKKLETGHIAPETLILVKDGAKEQQSS